jgi:hypothetical protein
MLRMEESPALRESARRVILGEDQGYSPVSNAYAGGEIYAGDPFFQRIKQIVPDDAKRRTLLSALAADAAGQTLADRYFPRKRPLAVLLFTPAAGDTARFTYGISNAVVYVTEEFTKTAALLRQWEALPDAESPDVEKIILQRYDPYAGMNALSKPVSPYFMSYRAAVPTDFMLPLDFGKRPEITEPAAVAALTAVLQSCYFANDGGFLAAAKLRGKEEYIYLYLPYDRAPPYVREGFGGGGLLKGER